jgi:hypothetical protein
LALSPGAPGPGNLHGAGRRPCSPGRSPPRRPPQGFEPGPGAGPAASLRVRGPARAHRELGPVGVAARGPGGAAGVARPLAVHPPHPRARRRRAGLLPPRGDGLLQAGALHAQAAGPEVVAARDAVHQAAHQERPVPGPRRHRLGRRHRAPVHAPEGRQRRALPPPAARRPPPAAAARSRAVCRGRLIEEAAAGRGRLRDPTRGRRRVLW